MKRKRKVNIFGIAGTKDCVFCEKGTTGNYWRLEKKIRYLKKIRKYDIENETKTLTLKFQTF